MKTITATLAILFCTLVATAHATAQTYIISDPRLTDEQRDCVIMTLELDEEQTKRYDELATAYSSEVAQIIAELEEMGSEFEEEGEEFTFERGIELWEEVSSRILARQKMLFDDLALFLTEEQAGRIDLCRTRLRRMGVTNSGVGQDFPFGIALGIDPITLAIDLGLPASLDAERRAGFERALTSYDIAMQRHIEDLVEDLVDFAGEADAFRDDPFAAFAAQQEEIQRIVDAFKDALEDHRSLGYAIGRTLPERTAAEWEDRYTRALYPGPYAPIEAEVLVDRLLDQTVLTDEEFTAVLDIDADLKRRTASVREEWCDEIDDFLDDFEFTFIALTSLDPDRIARPFRQRMDEIDDQTIAKLRERVHNPIVEEIIASLRETPAAPAAEEALEEAAIEVETTTSNDDDG